MRIVGSTSDVTQCLNSRACGIYADLTAQNETLLKYLVQLNTQSQTTALLAATNDRVVQKGSIISEAKSRWQENMKGVRSSTGTDGDDTSGGDGEESVDR